MRMASVDEKKKQLVTVSWSRSGAGATANIGIGPTSDQAATNKGVLNVDERGEGQSKSSQAFVRLKEQANFVLRLAYPIDQLQDYGELGAAGLHLQPPNITDLT